jgi:hypothetical protein
VIDNNGKIQDVTVRIETNWWLFLYNLSQQVLGGGSSSGLPASALIELGGVDSDANDTDAISLRLPIENLEITGQPEIDTYALLQPLSNALLLAQDALLPDPVAQAQPVSSISVGASPATYTAAYNGSAVVVGGTVSAIALTRQGTSVATGLTAGIFPLSRGDGLVITHTGAPTATFLPR